MSLKSIFMGGSAGFRLQNAENLPEPPSITDEVAVWWAEDLALGNGAAVSSWTDRVNSFELTQSGSNRPTLNVDGIGGNKSVTFDRDSSQHMAYTAANPVSVSSDGCIVMVMKVQDIGENLQCVWSTSNTGGSATENLYFSFYNNIASIYHYQFWQGPDNDGAISNDTSLVYEVSTDGSYWDLLYDNSVRDSAHFDNIGHWFGDVPNRQVFRLGALGFTGTASYLDGEIAYFGVFDSPLSDSDRNDLYNWIAEVYGVTVGPPTITDESAVWWAEDLSSLSDSDPVSTWTDRVNSLDLTASTTHRPTLTTSGINSKLSVEFDASSEQMIESATGSNPTSSEDGSIVAVILPNNTAAIKTVVGIASVPHELDLRVTAAERGELLVNSDNSETLTGDGTISTASPSILEVASDGSDTAMYLNNVAQSLASNDGEWTADADFNSSNTIFTIGGTRFHTAPAYYALPFDGQIAFIGVYDSPLSAGDREDLYNWISVTYGIEVS